MDYAKTMYNVTCFWLICIANPPSVQLLLYSQVFGAIRPEGDCFQDNFLMLLTIMNYVLLTNNCRLCSNASKRVCVLYQCSLYSDISSTKSATFCLMNVCSNCGVFARRNRFYRDADKSVWGRSVKMVSVLYTV